MPRDGLALAVLICCEDEFVRVLEKLPELRDLRLLLRRHHIDGFEVVLGVHSQTSPRHALELCRNLIGAFRQIPNVTNGSVNDIAFAEIARNAADLVG